MFNSFFQLTEKKFSFKITSQLFVRDELFVAEKVVSSEKIKKYYFHFYFIFSLKRQLPALCICALLFGQLGHYVIVLLYDNYRIDLKSILYTFVVLQ